MGAAQNLIDEMGAQFSSSFFERCSVPELKEAYSPEKPEAN